jgi:hypothetical protein
MLFVLLRSPVLPCDNAFPRKAAAAAAMADPLIATLRKSLLVLILGTRDADPLQSTIAGHKFPFRQQLV